MLRLGGWRAVESYPARRQTTGKAGRLGDHLLGRPAANAMSCLMA